MRILYNNEELELIVERCSDPIWQKNGFETFIATTELHQDLSVVIFTKSGIVDDIIVIGSITVFEDDDEATKSVLTQRAQETITELINAEDVGVQDDKANEEQPDKAKPYDPDKIKVRQDKLAIDYVVNKLIPRGLLDLNPDFQRRFVWDRKRQSRLIESIMLGIPIPFMYLSESTGNKFNVVDGLQRLSTFRDFIANKFPLKDLEHLHQYEGMYFNEKAGKSKKYLDTTMQTRIESFQLYFNIIDKNSPDEVKYDIFERLNTGGLPLNAQEIRNCNAENSVRGFLKIAAGSDEFKTATDNSVKGKRMDDQELVLRFTGFYLQKKGLIEYSGNMKLFLNSVNEHLNKVPQVTIDSLKSKFINSMKVCYYLFGSFAFRKCLPDDLLPGARKLLINKSMFIVWSVLTADLDYNEVASTVSENSLAVVLADKMIIKESKPDGTIVITSSEYNQLFTTGTFDVKNLNSAFSKTQDILNEFNF